MERALSRLFDRRRDGVPVRLAGSAGAPGSFQADIGPSRVVITAADAEGAFRGLMAASEGCSGGAFRKARAGGVPAFSWRGVLEGFYGKPWSWAERRAMADWMAKRRMNLLVVAPKDEPSQRRDWRLPMTDSERSELKRLVDHARDRFVEVAWSLSPGLDLDPDSGGDLAAARAKLQAAASAGVRKFVIAFDDLAPSVAQVRFANALVAQAAPLIPGADWVFVPAEYWGDAAPSSYLRAVARELDARYAVGWTGGQVLARRITTGEAERFARYIGHRLVLGDNYPAQDRAWGAGRLFLGPLAGREPGLSSIHAAFLVNASPLPAASRVPIATAAEYAWDPAHYDPAQAWRRALAAESGAGRALSRFAAYSSASWLDGPVPAPAVVRLEDLLEAASSAGPAPELRRELAALARLCFDLDRDLGRDSALRRELDPWVAKLGAQARAALAILAGDDGAEDLIEAADGLQAVVAGQALDRFLHRRQAIARGLAPPDLRPAAERVGAFAGGELGSRIMLGAALDRLAGGPAILSGAAGDRAALWRARSRFISLAAARSLLEDYFDRTEASWTGARVPARPFSLRGWLWVIGRTSPDCLPAELAAALERDREGDPRALRRLFDELALLPGLVRERLPGQLAEEGTPWLDKVGDYGRLGLLAADLRARGRQPTDAERVLWEELRYRLRSSNGLELVLELKLDLDAFMAWSRLPASTRPPRPEPLALRGFF